MARGSKGYPALVDAHHALRVRTENAKIRSTACVTDSLAVMERIRRRSARRGGTSRIERATREFIVEATRAFTERPQVHHANLIELKRHLEQIRAHCKTIAALNARFHSVKRNC